METPTILTRLNKGQLNPENVKTICASKGYWFPSKDRDFNLFIFGIRSRNKDQSKDLFDDLICIIFPEKNRYNVVIFEGTTDPGRLALTEPQFLEAIKNGTAILVEGQYRGAYQMGTMGTGSWKHPALLQIKPVKIYRDGNKDNIIDMVSESITEGMYGINIHASSLWHDLKEIGRYSAGCQVIRKGIDYEAFLKLLYNQVREGMGMKYTYTLFNESDFD